MISDQQPTQQDNPQTDAYELHDEAWLEDEDRRRRRELIIFTLASSLAASFGCATSILTLLHFW